MKSFKEFYDKLKEYTAEEIIKSIGFDKADVYDNIWFITDNQDGVIKEFFKSINTEIEDYEVGYCLIHCENEWYKIPYEDPKRLDNAMVLIFDYNEIYNVTDSYKN